MDGKKCQSELVLFDTHFRFFLKLFPSIPSYIPMHYYLSTSKQKFPRPIIKLLFEVFY